MKSSLRDLRRILVVDEDGMKGECVPDVSSCSSCACLCDGVGVFVEDDEGKGDGMLFLSSAAATAIAGEENALLRDDFETERKSRSRVDNFLILGLLSLSCMVSDCSFKSFIDLLLLIVIFGGVSLLMMISPTGAVGGGGG